MADARIQVEGMVCMGCVGSLQGWLMQEPGVTKALVSLAENVADVEFDEARLSLAQIHDIVREAGFEPT